MSGPEQRNSDTTSQPVVEGAATTCSVCHAPICLRKQVINLALGNTDAMLCLLCLAAENESTATDVMMNVMEYVAQRDCFRKEWIKYKTVEFCPAPSTCLPEQCFSRSMTGDTD